LRAASTGKRVDIESATVQMERALRSEGWLLMPREGAITFRDIVGKLAILRIECDKCGRSGQYRVDRLIARYGVDGKLFEWSDAITADCPRKQVGNLNDICGAKCPDLPKVV
jgi:hypothetical protein